MHVCTVLNQTSGTLRTMDVEQFATQIRQRFETGGHTIDIQIINGDDLMDTLDQFASDRACQVILAGGGDGTISAAAQQCWTWCKSLGIIPTGTMNLFARSLGIPLNPTEAIEALIDAKSAPVDIATANDRLFLHQISAGLQPKIVKLRDKQQHQSRVQKMFAGVKAALSTFSHPPRYCVDLSLDGKSHREHLSLIAIANNKYGRGHMPYADFPQQGEPGIYTAQPLSTQANLKSASDMLLGTWDTNPNLVERGAKTAILSFEHSRKKPDVTIDGELVKGCTRFEVKIPPKALSVLAPIAQTPSGLFG